MSAISHQKDMKVGILPTHTPRRVQLRLQNYNIFPMYANKSGFFRQKDKKERLRALRKGISLSSL